MTELEQSRIAYANGYYATKLKEGAEFQDCVAEWVYPHGIIIVGYASRRYQQKKGENMLGAEIKRDGRFRETGNLYIETDEKAHPDRPQYVRSGIHRGDNAWLYIIGDERTIWVFSLTMLRGLESRYQNRRAEIPTSRGFLLPIADADKYADKKLVREAPDG